jgi:chemotaxis protein CheX
MRAEYINPFVNSTTKAFHTMLSCDLTRGSIYLHDGDRPIHEVSGMIGLSGVAQGMVVLSMTTEVALKVASTMLMMDVSEVNADVIDAVGELTNVVAGSAKADLEKLKLSIGLPNVVVGRDYQVCFPTNAKPIVIPFESQWGPVTITVGFNGVEANVGVLAHAEVTA